MNSNKLSYLLTALIVLTGMTIAACGGKSSLGSPQTYGENPGSTVSATSDSDRQIDSDEKEPLNRFTTKSDSSDSSKAESEDKENDAASAPDSSKDEDKNREALDSDLFYSSADADDSSSAVDDDIWRKFDLAEEYHAMGVIANREASWEEAQYYFDKSLKVLSKLDVESDSLDTPEAVKYNRLLDNIVADYRITLRSLGHLEGDASSSVILERFADIAQNLGADSLQIDNSEDRPVTYDIPIVMNDRVKKSIVYYQTVAHDVMAKFLRRIPRYTPMMKEILREYGLPEDLIYLSMVESGYNPHAYSWARAMGLWQFISSTGRLYKLDRNWWYDERKDPIKSTHAAAQFLKDLYEQFGSWELAMAAYNGGPGRVSRTIKRQKTIDFWKMRLKRQTMDYVPLIMAAAVIAKNPEKYGFHDIEFENEIIWDVVQIDKCLELSVVAKAIGCSTKELQELNPELLRKYTPPNVKKYELKIPVGLKDKFFAAYDGLPSPKETSWVKHKIRRGETISLIASKYGVSQYAILEANNLSRRSTIYAGKNIIVPVPLDRGSDYWRSGKNRDYTANNSIYVVRSGDTMWDIARAFGTTVNGLRRINYIERGSRIYVGQKLKIPSNASKLKNKNNSGNSKQYASSSNKSSSKSVNKTRTNTTKSTYKVRSGDTLWDIARKFGTTTSKLRSMNSLGRSSRIYPGQVLTVTGSGGSDYVVHRVRRGESLSRIANRYRTSISRILATNNIDDPDMLQVGDRLKIYVK